MLYGDCVAVTPPGRLVQVVVAVLVVTVPGAMLGSSVPVTEMVEVEPSGNDVHVPVMVPAASPSEAGARPAVFVGPDVTLNPAGIGSDSTTSNAPALLVPAWVTTMVKVTVSLASPVTGAAVFVMLSVGSTIVTSGAEALTVMALAVHATLLLRA